MKRRRYDRYDFIVDLMLALDWPRHIWARRWWRKPPPTPYVVTSSQYDPLTSFIHALTGGTDIVLLVANGEHGSGYSVHRLNESAFPLASTLRSLANEIDRAEKPEFQVLDVIPIDEREVSK